MSANTTEYMKMFGNIVEQNMAMAKCACVACNSCTCACSCKAVPEFEDGEEVEW